MGYYKGQKSRAKGVESMAKSEGQILARNTVGRLLAFHRDPLGTLGQIARDQGPVARFRMGAWAFALVSGGAEVQELLNKNGKDLQKGPGMDSKNPLIGRGLLVAGGELWKAERLAVQPLFDHQRLKTYGAQITHAAVEYRERFSQNAVPVSVDGDMLALTLKVVLNTLFSADDTSEAFQDISQAVQTVMTYFYKRSRSVVRFPYSWRVPGTLGYHRAADSVTQWMEGILRESPPSFLAGRLQGALPQDQDAVLQSALTLIMAGHETTGHALSWTLAVLAQHPGVQRRLHAEVDAALGGQLPQASDVDVMPYLRAVILESLRLYPPVWIISRSNPGPVAVGAEEFAPHTFFLVSPYVSQHLPSEFPRPEVFDPGRWTGDSLPHGAYLPFGQGPRSCVGRDFALLEMQLILATLAQTLEFHADLAQIWRPVPRLSLVPPKDMVLTVGPRESGGRP